MGPSSRPGNMQPAIRSYRSTIYFLFTFKESDRKWIAEMWVQWVHYRASSFQVPCQQLSKVACRAPGQCLAGCKHKGCCFCKPGSVPQAFLAALRQSRAKFTLWSAETQTSRHKHKWARDQHFHTRTLVRSANASLSLNRAPGHGKGWGWAPTEAHQSHQCLLVRTSFLTKLSS